jgi:hypothetical protein
MKVIWYFTKFRGLTLYSAASIKANLHLFDHSMKPIVLYGSEIWGMLKTNSAACKEAAINISEKIYQNNVADKINLKFCKFTLGVNSKSSNIAVLSELGRFPLYFNIVFYIEYIIAAQIY